MHALFYCIALNLFWLGFEQTYPLSSFTHLGYSKTCLASASKRSQGISPPFLPLPPTLHWGSAPWCGWCSSGLCTSALSLSHWPSSSSAPLLSRTATERKCELSRLYLPPKSTSQGACFASLVTSSLTILLMVPSNQLLWSSKKPLIHESFPKGSTLVQRMEAFWTS